MIFKDVLVSMLEYGERCETDGGYHGSALKFVKCPKGVWGESVIGHGIVAGNISC
jgi:hypothetical protein